MSSIRAFLAFYVPIGAWVGLLVYLSTDETDKALVMLGLIFAGGLYALPVSKKDL